MLKFCKYTLIIALFSMVCLSSEAATSKRSRSKEKTSTLQQSTSKGDSYKAKLSNYVHTFYIEKDTFYCDGGIYYQHIANKGYKKITMPKYVTVQELPYGARKTYVNGYSYYEADGMWFQPIKDRFLIVEKPMSDTFSHDTLPRNTHQATFGF